MLVTLTKFSTKAAALLDVAPAVRERWAKTLRIEGSGWVHREAPPAPLREDL